MSEDASVQTRRRLSDGLLLTFLTAGAYWIAFRYEAAFLRVYGFPPHLVHVSLESTLVVLLLIGGGLWLLFPLANFVALYWPTHPALQEKSARLTLLLGLVAWHVISYGLRREDWVFYVIAFSFIVLFELIWPMLVFHDRGTLKERFIADEIAEVRTKDKMLFGRTLTVIGPAAYGLVLLIILGGWLADTAGQAEAKTKRHFLVYASDPALVVVRLYSDRVLCVHIDVQKHQFQGIVIRPVVDMAEQFVDMEIGPLKERPTDKT